MAVILNNTDAEYIAQVLYRIGDSFLAGFIREAICSSESELAQRYRAAVPVSYGTVECDKMAPVSFGADAGAYVQTWTWVPEEAIHVRQE